MKLAVYILGVLLFIVSGIFYFSYNKISREYHIMNTIVDESIKLVDSLKEVNAEMMCEIADINAENDLLIIYIDSLSDNNNIIYKNYEVQRDRIHGLDVDELIDEFSNITTEDN